MMADRRSGGGAMAEPIGPKPPPRPRLDWGTRTRVTIGDAERYTRFVGIMKRALFGLALLLVGAVLVYSLQPGQQKRMAITFAKLGMVAGDLAMINPKLNGTDNEGNPFVVTADTAIQNPKNMRQAALKNVEADVNLKGGRWLNLTAPRGQLDSDAKTLNLFGAISLFTDDGDEMHTSLAYIDMAKGLVIGPRYVRGQGPQGTYEADQFRIERLSDPCTKSKRAHPQISKPKHANSRPEVICPARVAGAPIQKTKPIIYLMGHVRMILFLNQGKKT